MSNAYRCNSCNDFFDPLNIEEIFGVIGQLSFRTSENYKNDKVSWHNNDTIHLCPICAKTIMIWLGIYDEIQTKVDSDKRELEEKKKTEEEYAKTLFNQQRYTR